MNYTISDKLSLGYNGTWHLRQFNSSEKWEKTKNWMENALYINSDPKKWLGFTLRLEYFEDKQNLLGLSTAIFQLTFSANFKINTLTIIPEFRFEKAGRKMFCEMDGTMADNKQNFLLAAAYHF